VKIASVLEEAEAEALMKEKKTQKILEWSEIQAQSRPMKMDECDRKEDKTRLNIGLGPVRNLRLVYPQNSVPQKVIGRVPETMERPEEPEEGVQFPALPGIKMAESS